MTIEYTEPFNFAPGPATRIHVADVKAEAKRLNVQPAVIWAIMDVEASGRGFINPPHDKRPKILFEAHIFSRETKGIWNRAHPNISSPKWNRALYGRPGAHQYTRLRQAMHLNETAALKSASVGLFQIMGFNHRLCGFDTVHAFWENQCISEAEHLRAFHEFCIRRNIVRHMREMNWRAFTRAYNGPGQIENYSQRLLAAYRKRSAARTSN